jgi:hypothetical protein
MGKRILISIIGLLLFVKLQAREGMWIPLLIKYNIEEMQQMGFELTAEDIYNQEGISMKDAIVHFGGGCTGAFISNNGLLVTNHHCGYDEIQSHSSIENDYLANGFWAMTMNEELPNPELTITLLKEMKEVTDEVLDGTDTIETKWDRDMAINEKITAILNEVKGDKEWIEASIKPFFYGKRYFLFVSQTFSDVRLVGAPPSSIGKFGGDTDNWMWPRHTGDFSLFRVYADQNNQPANYSTQNIPYKPAHYFPIKIEGINEGDFTLVFGYPGTTQQYLPSLAIEQVIETVNPTRIAIRDLKLEIMSRYMQSDRAVAIQYSAKYARVSNAWKKWKGELLGLKRLDAVNVKQQQEKQFENWMNETDERKNSYSDILPAFNELYEELTPFRFVYELYTESVFRGFDAFQNYRMLSTIGKNISPEDINEIQSKSNLRFKDFYHPLEKEMFTKLIAKYYHDLPQEFVPEELAKIFQRKNPEAFLEKIFDKSLLNNQKKLNKLLESAHYDKIKNTSAHDDLFGLIDAIVNHFNVTVNTEYWRITRNIDDIQKRYMHAILEMNKGNMLFPDANSTLRVTYGKVEGYEPRDGVNYMHYTTLDGIIAKEDPLILDYHVDTRLKELYKHTDYGEYTLPGTQMPVCFTASNHTTGGNSGSPVIDSRGNLIGLNFDRCWEGTMSDLMFDPEKCRNISLDMRYMLFIIDKYAGAKHLVDEMKVIK